MALWHSKWGLLVLNLWVEVLQLAVGHLLLMMMMVELLVGHVLKQGPRPWQSLRC
jgi:hypothetical protein